MTVHAYDYAILRLVPDVCRGACANVGVALHSRTAHFLGVRTRLDAAWLDLCAPALDRATLRTYLEALVAIGAGGAEAGPIGLLPPSERFHWLTAPRSTIIQPGDVRGGRSADVAAAFERLCEASL